VINPQKAETRGDVLAGLAASPASSLLGLLVYRDGRPERGWDLWTVDSPAEPEVPAQIPNSFGTDLLRLAVDPDGSAFAVLAREGDSPDSLLSATRPPGGEWSDPQVFATSPALTAPQRGVAIHTAAVTDDGVGDVLVAYSIFGGMMVRRRPAGGEFGPAQAVGLAGATPAVALDRNGDAILAWSSENGVHMASSRRGGPFGKRIQLSKSGDSPAVALAPDGRFVVAWRQRLPQAGRQEVWVRRGRAGTPPRKPHLLVSPPLSKVRFLDVAAGSDGRGRFVVGWHANVVRGRQATTAWIAELAPRVIRHRAVAATYMQLAMTPDGGGVLYGDLPTPQATAFSLG
jgi:hypothetical protein